MATWYEKSFNGLTSGLDKGSKDSLEALLIAWADLKPRPTEEQIRKYFIPISRTYKEESDGIWKQAQTGDLVLGDIVRVREDALTGRRAERWSHLAHMEARVVGIRYGAVSLKALDPKDSDLESLNYKIDQLDKRIDR